MPATAMRKSEKKPTAPALKLTRPAESPMDLWGGALTPTDKNRLSGALSRREYKKVHVRAHDRDQPTHLKGTWSQYQRWSRLEELLRLLARKGEALGVNDMDRDIAARVMKILSETFVNRPKTPYVTRKRSEDDVD